MNHIYSKSFCHRDQKRRKNDQCCCSVKKHSHNQHKYQHNQNKYSSIRCDLNQQIRSNLRNVFPEHISGKHTCCRENQQNTCSTVYGLHHNLLNVFQFQTPIYKHTTEQRIQYTNSCAFCWSKDTNSHSHDNTDRHQQSPDRGAKLFHELFCRYFFFHRRLISSGLGNKIIDCQKGYTHDNSRDITCQEHITNRTACCCCVNNQSNSRRNNRSNTTGCCRQSCGISKRISSLYHLRAKHPGFKCCICTGRTGKTTHEGR